MWWSDGADASGNIAGDSSGFVVPLLGLQHCDKMRIYNRRCALLSSASAFWNVPSMLRADHSLSSPLLTTFASPSLSTCRCDDCRLEMIQMRQPSVSCGWAMLSSPVLVRMLSCHFLCGNMPANEFTFLKQQLYSTCV